MSADLVRFIEARIAEDEAPTWTLVPYDCEPGCCAPEHWMGAQCRYCDPAPVYGGTVEAMTQSAEEHAESVHQRARVLRQCEAFRRIVEDAQSGWFGPDLDRALGHLAAIWSDHPDYRAEWAA